MYEYTYYKCIVFAEHPKHISQIGVREDEWEAEGEGKEEEYLFEVEFLKRKFLQF